MAVKAKASITVSHLIDILSVTRYYLLQSSTSAAPAKPTTNPPSSSWTKTEPSYTAGSTNTLYFVDLTTFTNGTFKYSEVSKSSSYEAAKAAYNKAAAVETRVTTAETQIKQNKTDISLRATKTEVTNYVASRRENLVTNGTALLGDNTNFSRFTYDGGETYYSGGSFKFTGMNALAITDEYISVDVFSTYTLSYAIKSAHGSETTVFYDGLDLYDIDKLRIGAGHTRFHAGSTTTLAQDLNDGDTVVHLTSVAGFNPNATLANRRGLIFWNYTNSKGYTYEPETYSRNVWSSLWSDGSTAIDTANNTITLDSAWTHGTFSAGTPVSQAINGGGYLYLNHNYQIAANVWTQKTGSVSGVVRNPSDNDTKFREGVAFVKILWLLNYSSVASTCWITNVTFTQNVGIAEVNAINKKLTDAETAIEQNAEAIALRATKTEVTTAVNSIQVGGRNYILNSVFEKPLLDAYDSGESGWAEPIGSTSVTIDNTVLHDGHNTLHKQCTYVNDDTWYESNYYFANDRRINFSPNETWTLSLWIYSKIIPTEPLLTSIRLFNTNWLWASKVCEIDIGDVVATKVGAWERVEITFNTPATIPTYDRGYIMLTTEQTTNCYMTEFKLEKGNKATDWSPAPEDIDNDIDDTANDIQTILREQNDSVMESCNDGIGNALNTIVFGEVIKSDDTYTKTMNVLASEPTESTELSVTTTTGETVYSYTDGSTTKYYCKYSSNTYTTSAEYAQFKSTTTSQLNAMAEQIVMNFTTTTELIDSSNASTQNKFNELSKYIRFNTDGIEIGENENRLKLKLDNDMIRFERDGNTIGWWDGVDFHTGNVIINVTERAQFGNFAFVPRSDGSLMFLKVGNVTSSNGEVG